MSFCFCRTHIYPISLLPLILSTLLGYGFPTPIFLAALSLVILPMLKLSLSRKAPITYKPAAEETLLEPKSSQAEEQSSITDEQEEEEYEVRRELTDGECEGRLSSTTSEESEVDYWPFQGNMFQSPDCFDTGYISDEESLIEIALPGGEFVRHPTPMSCKDGQFGIRSSFFKQMMIDEDNLIEIDISIGSIKSTPRFGIEAS
ncbi:hypothetical protein LINGRAHAP2_LOCUS19153 [Linum grandiflorum]